MLLLALLAMLATSVAHADNQSEPQNQIAIGLPVLDRGVSLWLVRPKTMWGLEFDALESSWDELSFDHSVETDTRRKRYHIHSALTVKRRVSEGQVAQFAYLTVYAEHREAQLAEDILLWTDSGLEVGLGGLWRPWKKVSVLLRQGFAFAYSEKTQSAFPDELRAEDLKRETFSLYLTKPRLLVLLHF